MNKQPPTNSQNSVPGPDDIVRAELPNGIVIMSRANFNSPSIVIRGSLEAGSIFDPEEKLGLADFTSAALLRGTEQYDFKQIYNALESAGATLGVSCAIHTVSFRGKALVEDLNLLLSLLSEALCHPLFPEEQIERLRAQLMTGLAIRAQDTGEVAAMAFDQLVYPGHPYSRPEDGYPETVSAIKAPDLAVFHQEHYGPQNMVISIVGGVDPQRAVEEVTQVFGSWNNHNQAPSVVLPPVAAIDRTITKQITIPGKQQADIFIGAVGPARISPDFYAAAIGNNILGQFGMMGRIGAAVREKAGLAYHVTSNLTGGVGPGPWYASAGVDPMNVEQAIELVRQEIHRFVSEPVSSEELSDSQTNFIGRLPLALESNAGVAAALVNLERYQLPLDHYCRFPDIVRAVTREKILGTAQHYLDPNRLAVAVAGPAQDDNLASEN